MSESVQTRGWFIVVEGADGVGKTLLCQNLAEALRGRGLDVLELREPGGCRLAEHLRNILKGSELAGALTDARAEALLFAAARAQLVAEIVRPALAEGRVVLADRHVGSSVVYQGLARGLGAEIVRDISEFAVNGVKPDLVLLLTVSEETASARRQARDGSGGDRIEQALSARSLREGYRSLHQLMPEGLVEIEAEGSPAEVLARALAAVDLKLR